jgi:hypothetical protein
LAKSKAKMSKAPPLNFSKVLLRIFLMSNSFAKTKKARPIPSPKKPDLDLVKTKASTLVTRIARE